jgi:LysM repeat protein
VIIAARFGTTVSQLQSANCLTDINRIFVGQTLYVPGSGDDVAPAATLTPTVQQAQPIGTPLATATQIDTEGQPPDLSGNSLTVRPTLAGDGGTLITLQPTVALDIGTVPDAAEVRYLAQTSPTDPNPVVVATDDDPFDGTRVEYTFNEFDSELYFYAIAENEFGSSTSFIQHVVYDPTYAVGSGKPDIFPFLGFDGSIYTLEPGRTVTVAWTNAPTDAQRIEFLLIQGTGTTLINTDTNPSDGARILWPVPAQLRGQVFARAVYADSSTVETEPVFVYSETE